MLNQWKVEPISPSFRQQQHQNNIEMKIVLFKKNNKKLKTNQQQTINKINTTIKQNSIYHHQSPPLQVGKEYNFDSIWREDDQFVPASPGCNGCVLTNWDEIWFVTSSYCCNTTITINLTLITTFNSIIIITVLVSSSTTRKRSSMMRQWKIHISTFTK